MVLVVGKPSQFVICVGQIQYIEKLQSKHTSLCAVRNKQHFIGPEVLPLAEFTTNWGSMNPNSAGQLWSRWKFRIFSAKSVPFEDIKSNAVRWIRKGFGTAGQARISEVLERGRFIILIEVEVEGVPAHDPDYLASVKRGFRRFVEQGWGLIATFSVETEIMAGDIQNGQPRAQLVVIPKIRLEDSNAKNC